MSDRHADSPSAGNPPAAEHDREGVSRLLTRRTVTDFRNFRPAFERALFWLIMLPVLLIAGSCCASRNHEHR